MNKTTKITTSNLILKGYLWVNIPIVILIIGVWYVCRAYFNLSNTLSILIGVCIGWIYWEFSIKKWIKWALDNNVSPERLLKIGQMSLLLWNKNQIDKQKAKKG